MFIPDSHWCIWQEKITDCLFIEFIEFQIIKKCFSFHRLKIIGFLNWGKINHDIFLGFVYFLTPCPCLCLHLTFWKFGLTPFFTFSTLVGFEALLCHLLTLILGKLVDFCTFQCTLLLIRDSNLFHIKVRIEKRIKWDVECLEQCLTYSNAVIFFFWLHGLSQIIWFATKAHLFFFVVVARIVKLKKYIYSLLVCSQTVHKWIGFVAWECEREPAFGA